MAELANQQGTDMANTANMYSGMYNGALGKLGQVDANAMAQNAINSLDGDANLFNFWEKQHLMNKSMQEF